MQANSNRIRRKSNSVLRTIPMLSPQAVSRTLVTNASQDGFEKPAGNTRLTGDQAIKKEMSFMARKSSTNEMAQIMAKHQLNVNTITGEVRPIGYATFDKTIP